MKVSIDSKELIKDVWETIAPFGTEFKVYAIYSLREFENNEYEYVSDFVDAEEPNRSEVETEEEFQLIFNAYNESLVSLENTKNKLMTTLEILKILEDQNDVNIGVKPE